jgi:hypothetical protein
MLITEPYREQQQELHKNPNYGVASTVFAPLVAKIINALDVRDLLDYGAGKMRLFESLKGLVSHPMRMQAYDPGVPKLAGKPVPAQMVTCIDVLEHIEPDCLDAVLDDLHSLTKRIGFFSIHTGPAVKKLPDGRNAHLIQQPPVWWLPRILERWPDLQTFQQVEDGFYVIVNGEDDSVIETP